MLLSTNNGKDLQKGANLPDQVKYSIQLDPFQSLEECLKCDVKYMKQFALGR